MDSTIITFYILHFKSAQHRALWRRGGAARRVHRDHRAHGPVDTTMASNTNIKCVIEGDGAAGKTCVFTPNTGNTRKPAPLSNPIALANCIPVSRAPLLLPANLSVHCPDYIDNTRGWLKGARSNELWHCAVAGHNHGDPSVYWILDRFRTVNCKYGYWNDTSLRCFVP